MYRITMQINLQLFMYLFIYTFLQIWLGKLRPQKIELYIYIDYSQDLFFTSDDHNHGIEECWNPCVSFASFSTQASWSGQNDVHFCPSILLHCVLPCIKSILVTCCIRILVTWCIWILVKCCIWILVICLFKSSSHIVFKFSSHVVLESSSHFVFESSSHVVLESSSHVVFEYSSHIYSNLRHMLYSNPSLTISTSNPSWRETDTVFLPHISAASHRPEYQLQQSSPARTLADLPSPSHQEQLSWQWQGFFITGEPLHQPHSLI